MPGTNHDWQVMDRYFTIHERCLDQVEEYFVVEHNVRFPVTRSHTRIRFRGFLQCLGGIEVFIDLGLVRDKVDRVRGRRFTYHAQISTPQVITVLRYDNAPHYPAHPDAFHKHLFDASGNPAGVVHIGRRQFPTLRNVIDEVFEWWKANRDDPRYYRQPE